MFVGKLLLQGLSTRMVNDIDTVRVVACPNCEPPLLLLSPSLVYMQGVNRCPLRAMASVAKWPLATVCDVSVRKVSLHIVRVRKTCAGSVSEGCYGYPSDRDLNLLWTLADRKVIGCQFVMGWRRDVCMHEFVQFVHGQQPSSRSRAHTMHRWSRLHNRTDARHSVIHDVNFIETSKYLAHTTNARSTAIDDILDAYCDTFPLFTHSHPPLDLQCVLRVE
jgi:hypothetical protein